MARAGAREQAIPADREAPFVERRSFDQKHKQSIVWFGFLLFAEFAQNSQYEMTHSLRSGAKKQNRHVGNDREFSNEGIFLALVFHPSS